MTTFICQSQVNNKVLDSLLNQLSKVEDKDVETQIKLHVDICNHGVLDHPELSIEHGTQALKLAKATDNQLYQAKALRAIGRVHQRLGNKYMALVNLMEANTMIKKLGDQKQVSIILNDIGIVYFQHNDFDEAEKFFKESLQIKKTNKNVQGMIHAMGNLAGVYMNKKEFEKAIQCVDFTSHLADSLNLPYYQAVAQQNKASVLTKMEKYDEAIPLYKQAISGFKNGGNKYELAITLKDFAEALLEKKDYNECIIRANEGLALAKHENVKLTEKDLHDILTKAYELTGDLENAHLHLTRYVHLSDSIYESEKEMDIARMEVIYNLKQKDEEIDKKNKSIAEFERKQYTNRLIWWLTTISIILLLTLAYIVYSRMKSRIRSMNVAIADKDKIIAEVALKVVNKDEVVDSLVEEKFKSGATINKKELEEYILNNHNQFISNLSKKYPSLTKKEIKICSLIKLQLSSKEIGVMLNLSPYSVDTYRYKIRKKIGLSSKDSMFQHLDKI